ncbi:MAG: hypothetical protein WCG80_16165 [Spirochaetales bacterium]
MKRILTALSLVALVASGAFAADVTVSASFNITGKDAVKSVLTVTGALGSVANDSVDPKLVDVVGGASLKKGTEVWNLYRPDTTDKKAAQWPAGFQSLVKYAVSNLAQYKADNLQVKKAADGVITIYYAHRGTAYKIITDKTGKLDMNSQTQWKRAIGFMPAGDGAVQVLSTDFASSAGADTLSFLKVFDGSVASGKVIKEGAPNKVADVFVDVAPSVTAFQGVAQLTLVGDVLTIKGDFNYKK